MIDASTQTSDREQRLDAILADYFKTASAGHGPEPEELIARYPELASELADFFADYRHLNRVVEPVRTALPAGAVGRSFGDYELLEEIARGGMGVVYKARQKSLNRLVALKMLFPGGHSRDDVERFLRTEAEVAAGLEHPHIVPIYEFGQGSAAEGLPPVPFLSMKLIEGGSLAQWIADCRLQIADCQQQAARLLVQVARAVHYAHQRGILHRDLKPANILLQLPSPSSQSAICTLQSAIPLVTDFGLAKRVEGEGPPGQSGMIVGTALYMAPEQAAGHKRLTTAADVYSLGAILYELVTGRPPFQGDTVMDTLMQVKEREPVRPRLVNPRLDRDLETICLKCLDKEPQRRYSSAEALAEDLERWQAGEPIRARPAGKVERLWRWGRRNPLVAGLSAAIVLVTALGLVGVLGQWQAALLNEQQANEQRDEAQQQRDDAQKQRDEVRALNEKLQATQAQLRSTLYAAHMKLAQQAWGENSVSRVLDLLDQYRPKAGEPDLRGFEWHYLHRLCHSGLLTLKGHTGLVLSVAFSPDGKRLASAAQDQTVRVWDAQTGQELRVLQGGGGGVAFSQDGKRLASSGKVWDAQTGQELLSLKGPTGPGKVGGGSVVFSPDGKRLAGTRAGEVTVWDAQTGQELLTLKRNIGRGPVGSVAYSPDGKRLASAGGGEVKLWEAQTGQELLTFKGHTNFVFGVAFSSDGKRLASAGGGGLKVWDAQTGQELLAFKVAPAEGRSVAFSPDGKRLASAGGRTVTIWDATPVPEKS